MHLDHLAVGSEEASDDGNTVTMVRMLIKEPEGDESTGKWLHHLQREVTPRLMTFLREQAWVV
jgi:hypothetical protein